MNSLQGCRQESVAPSRERRMRVNRGAEVDEWGRVCAEAD